MKKKVELDLIGMRIFLSSDGKIYSEISSRPNVDIVDLFTEEDWRLINTTINIAKSDFESTISRIEDELESLRWEP